MGRNIAEEEIQLAKVTTMGPGSRRRIYHQPLIRGQDRILRFIILGFCRKSGNE